MPKVIIVGSGPGGSVMAMELAEAGWDVVIFEMGPSYYTTSKGKGHFRRCSPTTSSSRSTATSSSPIRSAYPRTFDEPPGKTRRTPSRRRQRSAESGRRRIPALRREGHPNGGHRLQGMSCSAGARRSHGGFVIRAQRARPYYDEIETLIGVQGDVARYRHRTADQPQQSPSDAARGANALSILLAAGANALGSSVLLPDGGQFGRIQRFSRVQHLRFCSGYGCPISAKPGNLIMLRRALHTGRAQLRPQTTVTQVNHAGPQPPASPISTQRAIPAGKAPTSWCCPAPRS